MKFRLSTSLMAAGLMLLAVIARAGEPASEAVTEQLRKALEVGSTGLKVNTVEKSDIAGIYEVQFTSGPLVYASENGQFFLVGDLFSVGPDGYVNQAEKRRDSQRVEQLAAVDTEDMIIFPAEGETRAHVTVFTDVTCFYCQKLHKEVPELNRKGIEVRYLAYPRAGIGSDGYRKLAGAWCSANPQEALTKLKNKQELSAEVCPDNPVAGQYALGQEMGVRGTPAIVTESGQMIPGYQDAATLLQTLGLN